VIGSPPTHTRRRLLETKDLSVVDYTCRGHDPGWIVCDPHVGQALALVRRGAFRRRVRGTETLMDPGVAFFRSDEAEEEVAHPVAGGDDDTIVTLSPAVVADLMGSEPELPERVVFTSPETDLRHRLLLAACARGEAATAADHAVALATSVLHQADPVRIEADRPGTSEARRRVVDRAREALATNPQLGLLDLARAVSVSPYHLSRIFKAATGQTLTTYRSRLRIRSALDRLREGHDDLATVAADAGFADHAHLTRTFRRELGEVPSDIRHLIAPVPRWY
jgi:AraC-like DNA-binding protein